MREILHINSSLFALLFALFVPPLFISQSQARKTQNGMAENKSPIMAFGLKKMFTQLTSCLRRRHSRRLRSFGSVDRTVGLRSVLEDGRIVEDRAARRLERASISSYGNFEDDVDKRAQIFINNFLRHLRLERQISLELRYYHISETEDDEKPPPFSSI